MAGFSLFYIHLKKKYCYLRRGKYSAWTLKIKDQKCPFRKLKNSKAIGLQNYLSSLSESLFKLWMCLLSFMSSTGNSTSDYK